jgi:geranylgeranyl reductase family protein
MPGYDVAVVGGGPIGAAAARHASLTGARVLLIEQGDGSGEPVRCAGLVSPRTLKILGASGASTLRKIYGGLIHAPGGRTIALRSETVKGVVLDRGRLNRELLELAVSSGVEIRTKTRAIAAHKGQLTIEHKKKQEKIDASVIIAADGPRSAIASWFSLAGPRSFLVASQAVIVAKPRSEDGVEIFFGQDTAPGFFAWAIPAEDGRLRVGLACLPLQHRQAAASGTESNVLLDRLLSQYFPGKVVTRIGGMIPIEPAPSTVADGALILGDAAGQVKPTSGGGLYAGGICAKIAGEIAGNAAQAKKVTREALFVYEERWRKKIGKELRFGLATRRLLSALTDEEIDLAFAAIDRSEILSLISREGDIDYPSRLFQNILAQKGLLSDILLLLPSLGGRKRVEEIRQAVFAAGKDPPL